jgi:hypothetical protein
MSPASRRHNACCIRLVYHCDSVRASVCVADGTGSCAYVATVVDLPHRRVPMMLSTSVALLVVYFANKALVVVYFKSTCMHGTGADFGLLRGVYHSS